MEYIGETVTATARVESLPGWQFGIEVARTAGVAVLTRLAVEPDGDEPVAITTRLLASIPTRLIVRSLGLAVAALHQQLDAAGIHASPDLARHLSEWTDEFVSSPRPGRRGRGDLFYAELAAEYVARAETTSNPVEELAGERNLTASQIRNLLYEARQRGLLSKGVQGRAGGQLSDEAKEILDGQHR